MKWLVLTFALTGMACQACALPVFRHALERWPVKDYRLEVPTGDKESELIREIFANAAGNIRINRIEGSTDAVLFAPDGSAPLWTGKLDRETYKRISDSPARSELLRRILSGQTAVWILVSPEPERKSLRESLERMLVQYESNAKFPNIPAADLGPGPEFTLKFSVLELDPNDPNEAEFLSMLAGIQAPKNAFIAPVFGRGRVLGVMKPDAVTPKNIEQTCQFLIGSCSCQLDVGWDLLLAVDWSTELRKATPNAAKFALSSSTETKVIGAKPSPNSSQASTRNSFAWAVALIVLIGGGMWLVKRHAM